ncbi:MAG: CTP synthase [Rickettsiales bacterium]|nr:MAG: CTP synthase [Rickettsiales bacterium]
MVKFIFITGGVVSSLGKGIASASLGALLQARNYKVEMKKLDPYLNVDPGTMNPTQHGEVFVTDDGYEADLDLGHYERFTGVNTSKNSNITTGQIYKKIIEKERKGDFLGKTVQVVPHVTNEIKEFVLKDTENVDFVLCEIGGTVGDIEGLPFYESIRQLGYDIGRKNVCYIHLTYLPYIKMAEELKTKPTQHSVKSLQNLGIQPDILLCRADIEIPKNELEKIAMFCNVKKECVIPALNADSIYEVPLIYHSVGLDEEVCKHFSLNTTIDLSIWQNINNNIKNPQYKVKIAVVGKYTALKESYKSVIEALKHAGIANKTDIDLVWVEGRDIATEQDLKVLKDVDGILMTGGFGEAGTEGMISCIKYARENKVPYLGICFGMQLAIIEFCRNVLNIKDASTTEFEKPCTPVISLITEFEKDGKIEKRDQNTDLGGTLRLGSYLSILKVGSLLEKIYKKTQIYERHRHRYEFNNKYKQIIEEKGLIFSGFSSNEDLMECIELEGHPFFVAVQFHPELKSRPFSPAPLFVDFIKVSIKNKSLL